MKTILSAIALAIILTLSAIWLHATPSPRPPAPPVPIATPGPYPDPAPVPPAPAPPTLGVPTITPSLITVNTPTTVTVTVQITDSTLIPGSVNVLLIGATNTQPTILGVMHDDGKSGDTVTGDGTFSLQILLNPAATGDLQLAVSAAFKGLLKRVLSNISYLSVLRS